ncbi:pentapeptide repeat-containing protein, partial [Nostoc sp. PCC 9305]|uniref:pentapeptide repeat-containing protein n=1 Tax=Nostoc sp. PCC 9305 TaxID=296636 RepID=UPI0039C717FE
DLSNADLSNADLSNADLSNADLRYADLRYADLSNAVLIGTIARDATFGKNKGLTENIKLDLEGRGATFDDSSGELAQDCT